MEQGASIFVRVNTILYDAVQEFGLQLVNDDDSVEERLVIWDGETFRYEQNEGSSKWWNYAKLFWKYGMTPLKAKGLVDSTISRFLELYDEPHFPFTSLTQAAIDLDLVKLTGITGGQFLQESGVSFSLPDQTRKPANTLVSRSVWTFLATLSRRLRGSTMRQTWLIFTD